MAEKCTGMYDAFQRCEVSKRIDVLAGYLAWRYGDDADARRKAAGTAALGREALEESDIELARRHLADLEAEAEESADDPHYPCEPRAYEADAQVRDYVKDELRGRMAAKTRADRDGIRLSIDVTRNRLLFKAPALTTLDRHDVHYICGRATMALDLGHMDAARRERDRLREIEARYEAASAGR
ncbi:hypothetical protein [Streptomyces sp. NPDC046261]|uniref:hypothetical protein n=1 Tax=Streptomyces sp. NPDC046261 TaxID=3157200 RepID=UPI00340ECD05